MGKGLARSRCSSYCNSSKEDSVERDGKDDSVNNLILPQVGEEVIPDLADAMAELDEKISEKCSDREKKDTKSRHTKKKKHNNKKGAQVFFFPNEGGNNQSNQKNKPRNNVNSNLTVEKDFAQDLLPSTLGMTDSFYNPSTSMRLCSKNPEELDDNLIQIQNINHFGEYSSDASSSTDDELGHRSMDQSFFIVDRAIGTGLLPKNKPGETAVRYLDSGNEDDSGVITLHENHFAITQKTIDYLKAPKGYPSFKSRITLKQLSILWQIYGGRDFACDKNDQTVFHINASSAPDSHIRTTDTTQGGNKRLAGTFQNSDFKARGGLERNNEQLLEVYLSKISFQHELYPENARGPVNANYTMLQPNWNTNGHKIASRQIVLINSFEIRDRVKNSDINKLLHLYSSKIRPRQSHANMVSLRCVNIKPDFDYQPEESIINVSLQPLKINIDQDTLFFAANFVSGLFPSASSNSPGAIASKPQKPLTYQASPKLNSAVNNVSIAAAAAVGIHNYQPDTSHKPVKGTVRYSPVVETIEITPEEIGQEASEETFKDFDANIKKLEASKQNIDFKLHRISLGGTQDDSRKLEEHYTHDTLEDKNLSSRDKAASIPIDGNKQKELYIRSFIFTRDVPIRIDYAAKYVDLNASAPLGAIAGLLAGLTSLNCSELTLKRVCYNNGILGVDRLFTLLITEWLTDIRVNQIPSILGGVGPMYSVIQLLQGIKDLFLLPIEQYQKDGRIIRGIQKGANSFTSSTAVSFLDFTNRVLGVIKFAAEMAFEVMSPEGCIIQGKLPYHTSSDPSASLYAPEMTGVGRVNNRLRRRMHGKRNTSNIVKRPSDMREGMFSALAIVQEVGIREI